MDDRTGSSAYLALTPGGKRVLDVISREIERNGAARISRRVFHQTHGISRSAVGFGLKQLALCGFVVVSEEGWQRANVYHLDDGWRSLDADEAKRLVKLAHEPKPPRVWHKSVMQKPVKPAKPPKPPKIAQSRIVQRVTGITLPRLSCLSDGR